MLGRVKMNLTTLGNICEICIIITVTIRVIFYDSVELLNSIHQPWQEVEYWLVSFILLYIVGNVCIKLWRIKDED